MTDTRSDLDRHAVDALENATGIIEKYDPHRTSVLDLAEFGPKLAARYKRPMRPDRAVAMVQGMVMDFATSADTSIARISFDTDPEIPGRPQLRNHPDAAQVVFACIPEGTLLYKEGQREACAVAYYPQSTYEFTSQTSGEIVSLPSSFDRSGYSHVIAWFGTFTEADEQAQALTQALRDFSRLDPSAAPDDDLMTTATRRDGGRFDDIDDLIGS